MTVLVTGGSGFVGSHLIRRLIEAGKPVRTTVNHEAKARQRLGAVATKIEIMRADVRDRDALKAAMDGVTAVIHLVAIPIERKGQTYDEINYQGTINVVDTAEAAGVQRFINMSQNGAAPDHFSRFLRSKGKAQVYVAQSGMAWTALRPSAIFGPGDGFFNAIARLVRLTPVVYPLIGGGKALFQPVSVDDVVEAAVRSLDDEGAVGKEFALGGPDVLTLGEIEKRILQAMGTRRVLIPAPTGLLKPIVFVMEKTLPGTPVNLTLLELLKEPNVVPDNALTTYFHITPTAFAGDAIHYLRDHTVGSSLQALFGRDDAA